MKAWVRLPAECRELKIQASVERYHEIHGEFPPALSVALEGNPVAQLALARLGAWNVDYQRDDRRGYLLVFRRPQHARTLVGVTVEDHDSYGPKLNVWRRWWASAESA